MILFMLFFFSPALSSAEVFQWTDSRGVIHLTDNPYSVPESLRGSPSLIIRRDLDPKTPSEIPHYPEIASEEPPLQSKPPEAVGPPESEQKTVAPTNIQYNSQNINIVVINSVFHHPRRHSCPNPQGCQGTFQPNFEDRRYIHPSVFNGGSRQFVQPELFPPNRR